MPLAWAVPLCIVWGAVIWTAPHLHPGPIVWKVALFAHLVGLAVGFGAVLTVDWQALRWLFGRAALADVLRLARTTAVPIWAGLAVLTASGLLLHPNLAADRTRAKVALVLVIGLNGLFVHHLRPRLELRPLPRRYLAQACASAVISQVAWWSCTLIGFVNATSTPARAVGH